MNLTVIISLNYCIRPSLMCALTLTLYFLSLSLSLSFSLFPSFLFSLPLTPSAPLHPTFDFLVCIWNSLCYWCTTFLLFLISVCFVILLCYSVQKILCKRKGNKEYIYMLVCNAIYIQLWILWTRTHVSLWIVCVLMHTKMKQSSSSWAVYICFILVICPNHWESVFSSMLLHGVTKDSDCKSYGV